MLHTARKHPGSPAEEGKRGRSRRGGRHASVAEDGVPGRRRTAGEGEAEAAGAAAEPQLLRSQGSTAPLRAGTLIKFPATSILTPLALSLLRS